VGKNVIIGFPDNLSDENENEGEKLWLVIVWFFFFTINLWFFSNAPATATGLVSQLHDDGLVGATGNEDGKAMSRNKQEQSRVTRNAIGRRRARDVSFLLLWYIEFGTRSYFNLGRYTKGRSKSFARKGFYIFIFMFFVIFRITMNFYRLPLQRSQLKMME